MGGGRYEILVGTMFSVKLDKQDVKLNYSLNKIESPTDTDVMCIVGVILVGTQYIIHLGSSDKR